MKKLMLVTTVLIGGVIAKRRYVQRAIHVAKDPNVIAAWKDAAHDVGIAFNRSYRKKYTNYVDDIIKNVHIQKED